MNPKITVFPMAAVVISCLCIFIATPSKGDVFDVSASEDARVTSVFPDINEGELETLSLLHITTRVDRTYVYFDLSSLFGLTATGDGTLNVTQTGGVGFNLLNNGTLFVAFGSWDESSITWNNQPGPLGAPLDTVSGTFNESVNWNVPQATLQIWLDSPASNVGFYLQSDIPSSLVFHSSESGASPPRLIFNASLIGDVNRDGVVSLLDVAPFVELISSGTFLAEGDINQDGVVNLLDVSPFVALLSGG